VKNLARMIFARLVALAGGRPAVVLPLYAGIEQAAAGRAEILRQQSRRKRPLTASGFRILILVITALGSVFLSLFMVLSPSDFHPHLGVLILVGVHWLMVMNMVVGQAGPSLLVDDDLQVMGWWPVSRRELMLARLGTILKPALEVTAAMGTIPLLVYLVTGRPPVVSALVLGAGLLIQAVGVTFGVGVVLSLVVRLWGRRRAQRLAALLADGNLFMYIWFLGFLVPRLGPWFSEHLRVLYALPPLWFAAYGDLHADHFCQLMGLAGTAVSFVLVAVGLRLMVQEDAGRDAHEEETRPSRWHFSSVVSLLLRPMMPGREGWVVRRLLESHLREDWRFIGGMLTLPVMMAFMFFVLDGTVSRSVDPEDLRYTALTSINNSQFLAIMAATVIFLVSYSSSARALWIVALADLDTGRLLAAQRGLIRGLVVMPVLVIYAVKAALLGATPLVVILDCLILGLQVEIIVSILQPFIMIMPFSLSYTNEQTARRIGLAFLSGGVAIVFVALDFLYAAFGPARIAIWAGFPLLLWGAGSWQKRRVAGRRLKMEVVHDG